ncbi:unnamed protein product, partial [Closterium sp. Yama58-4]
LMVRSQWCPCNFSNGETIEEGMGKLDRWLTDLEMSHAKRAQGELPGLKDSLCHVRQAALLLTMKNKHRATVDDVRKLCPDLNGKQLGKICLWYQDEKYGTLGFDPDVNYELSDLADDDDAEMLKDDESVPFAITDLVASMGEINLDEVPLPPELRRDPHFRFLQPTPASEAQQPPKVPATKSMPPCHALSVSDALAESTPLPPTTAGSPRATYSPRGANFSASPYKTPFRLPASSSIVHDAVAMHHAAYGWTDGSAANRGEAGGSGAGAGGAAERRAPGSGGFGSSTALELTPPSSPSSAAADAQWPADSLRDLASNTKNITTDVVDSGVNGGVDSGGRHEQSSKEHERQHEGTEQESPARQFVRDLALVRALILADACTVAEASRRMAARHVDACLLTDAKSGMLCGILTDRDVAERCVGEGRSPQSTPCHAVMTRDPLFVSLHAPAAAALKKMVNGKFRHLPVVDGGEVVAMLPVRSCLAEALLRAEEVRGKGADVAEALKEAERTGRGDGTAAGAWRWRGFFFSFLLRFFFVSSPFLLRFFFRFFSVSFSVSSPFLLRFFSVSAPSLSGPRFCSHLLPQPYCTHVQTLPSFPSLVSFFL